jgi:hypothetical protein
MLTVHHANSDASSTSRGRQMQRLQNLLSLESL